MIPLRKMALVTPVVTPGPRYVDSASVPELCSLTRLEKPVPWEKTITPQRDMKQQKHYEEDASAPKHPSSPSRAARDGAYARTAMPKFSGGGGGSASTTRSMS